MKGLYNLGNTCYFNSALQCMLQTPQLSNFLILNEYTGDCEFTKEYQNIVREIWVKQTTVADPSKLLGIFKQKYKQFDNRNQHDSQEAFLCILDILDKSLNEVIRTLFYGVNSQETICKSGKSIRSEDFNISILLPKDGENTIIDILKSSQKWNGIKDYVDNEGKTWNVAATRTLYSKLPIILVFSIQMYGLKKKINFYEHLKINDFDYELYATSNHQGSVNGGHYVAFTKHKDTWYLKDDALVHELKEFPTSDYHYLAFYKVLFPKDPLNGKLPT